MTLFFGINGKQLFNNLYNELQVIRLESQVKRWKASSDESEKDKEDMKTEKRKLQREVKQGCQTSTNQYETSANQYEISYNQFETSSNQNETCSHHSETIANQCELGYNQLNPDVEHKYIGNGSDSDHISNTNLADSTSVYPHSSDPKCDFHGNKDSSTLLVDKSVNTDDSFLSKSANTNNSSEEILQGRRPFLGGCPVNLHECVVS